MRYIVQLIYHQKWLHDIPKLKIKRGENSWPVSVTVDASSTKYAENLAFDYFSEEPKTEDYRTWLTVGWVLPVRVASNKVDIDGILDVFYEMDFDHYMNYWEPDISGYEMLQSLMEKDPELYEIIYREYMKGD